VATECHIQFSFRFQPKLTLDFAGGAITSEAGLVLLREFDERLKLTAGLKGLVADERDRRYIEHPTLNLLRQRIYQIAAGYEDANDATFLRHDPTLRAVVGRGELPLASQPTLSRLEMPSLGNRFVRWSAWAWSGSCAVERKGGRAGKRSFWTSIRLLIRPTASSS
jgi:hypothetical protein